MLALVVAGCGGGNNSQRAAAAQRRRRRGKQGGTLKILDTAGGVDSLDPGYWYYQSDYQEVWQTDPAPLYGWKPTTPASRRRTSRRRCRRSRTAARPSRSRSSRASSTARRSRPHGQVGGRQVRDRALLPAAGRQRLRQHLLQRHRRRASAVQDRQGEGDLGHQDAGRHDARDQARRSRRRADGGDALALPCTVAGAEGLRGEVRPGQARRPTASTRSFTGPYMIAERRQGQITGYKPGKKLDAGPQPELGQVDGLPAGVLRQDRRSRAATTSTVARRQILERPEPDERRLRGSADGDAEAGAARRQKGQLSIAPSGGNRYISLNTKIKPLDNINVRKAIAAVDRPQRAAADARRPDARTDRDALPPAGHRRLRRGGRNEGPGLRLHREPDGEHGAREVVHEEGRLPERQVHRRRRC